MNSLTITILIVLVFGLSFYRTRIPNKSKPQNIDNLNFVNKNRPSRIEIDPEYPMWFVDNEYHPYLVGVSESGTISNLWGDPGEEWNVDRSRKSDPVTYPTHASFLWSEYLDTLAAYGINCVRELVIPSKLSPPAKYKHHYNPYPFPWARTDSNRNYIPGYRENKTGSPGTPGKINSNYLHSRAVPDFSKPQPGYFLHRVKRFCKEAEKRDIYVILTVFPIYPYFPYEPNNTNVKAYIDMLLKYTKNSGNVIYEINWEGGNGNYFTWWAGYIKDKLIADDRPPNVILVNHTLVRPSVVHSTENSTIVGHHRNHTHKSLLDSRKYKKPVIWTEDFDEGKTNKHTKAIADIVRNRTWYSFVTGVSHIWYDWSMRFGTYRDPIFLKAAASVITFINETNIPFWTMSPADSLATGEDNFVLANPGKHYVVYFSDGVKTGTTVKLLNGSYKARWFNPNQEHTISLIGQYFDVPPDGIFTPPKGSSSQDRLVLYIFSNDISVFKEYD